MKSHRLGSIRSEAGQGTLEYILVITVTVILFLTVIYQFNDAFRSYAEQFFDGYVACLLETGELPGRGGDCQAEMKKFNVADGKPLLNGPLGSAGGGSGSSSDGGSGNGGGGSGSGKDGKDASGANASKGGKGGSGGESGGGSGESAGSGNPNSVAIGSIGSRKSGRQASTSVGNKNSDDGGGGGKDSLIAPLPGMTGNGSDSANGRAKKTALDREFGYMTQEERQEAEKAKAPVQQVVTKNEAGDDLRANKTRVEASRNVASTQADDGGGFTFGGLIRIILITGIILAIVVFMGGQLMQISKSYEK